MLEVAKLPFNENNSVSAVKSLKRAQEVFFSLEVSELKAFQRSSLKRCISYGCLKFLYKLRIEETVTIIFPVESVFFFAGVFTELKRVVDKHG